MNKKYRIESFFKEKQIDQNILKAAKDLKKVGWKNIDDIESLFKTRLKNKNRQKDIPYLENQIKLIRRNKCF